ncbi:MAG: phosphoribosylformylglycinamidine synthase [Desulfovibrio sp.]|nr:phosphoribosylformylglycinamidine synthase [Desulfovibrio sp.]
MLYRIEAGPRQGLGDSQGRSTAQDIESSLGLHVDAVRQLKVFTADGLDKAQAERLVKEAIWHDPILQEASLEPLPLREPKPAWFIEVGFRPGVTDNEARTARDTAAMVLGIGRESLRVYTAVQYQITGELTRAQVERIASDLLCNGLIQRFRVKSLAEWEARPGFEAQAAKVTGEAIDTVDVIELSKMDDATLVEKSHANTWALSLQEMQSIKAHFSARDEAERRAKLNLPADPTDLEMECMAQTWSEHCKHKIFASKIRYVNKETGRIENLDNLYKTCIRDTTALIRKKLGLEDYCRSVFSDNAGVIAFNEDWDACIKVETHNSPSALDPYGGALTGIVGVNRDPMGTGMGADLLCNTDVFCFASPFYDKELPPRLLHPRRVLEGVRRGVEHGGNKSGIPTVNGSVIFDERYLGKPLVYCGTVGMLPRMVNGKPGWQKKAQVGDLIVMAGGRIGKDGIHGATFSSEELHEGSPATAVQIGDPITQRKMYDFIMRARDLGLYHAITDNGAGGLSSSVGEMAEDTNGCVLDISKAPLKYDGLRPWEILVSEAQERMTLAVPPEHIDQFLAMAKDMDVEATVLGTYTDSGYFEVRYGGRVVGSIDMAFMHEGVPQFKLNACWERPEQKDIDVAVPDPDQGAFLKRMLGRLDICSKEYIVRQYDHEVKGGSVIKPLCGVKRDGPADAGVIRPVLESDAGLVISHGICPRYSDYDTYWMMANAMDEAIRNAVAVGGNPDHMAGVDNFCWCDPVESPKCPDGQYKLAQLVRACKALRHFSLAYNVPCISGKDSMKNDYTNAGVKISIPPTVLFSVIGVISNIVATQTSDFKQVGDAVYMMGFTSREMGGSEAALELGLSGGMVPRVDAASALPRYRAIHALMGQRGINACHDCSDGGLAVALAEMCIGGRLGVEIDLDKVPSSDGLSATELLYSESASRMLVSVKPAFAMVLDTLGMFQVCRRIGTVTVDGRMTLKSGGSTLLSERVDELAKAFKQPLDW